MAFSRSIPRGLLVFGTITCGVSIVVAQSGPTLKAEPPREPLPPIFAPPAPIKDAKSESAPAPASSASPRTSKFLAPALLDTGKSAKPTVRSEIFSVIRKSFPYAPRAPREEEAALAGAFESELVVMKPFRVSGSSDVRSLDRVITEKGRKLKEEAFNFEDGGTVTTIGPVELKMKYDPRHGGWDLLNMRW